jgi:hypothetical protein
MTESETEEYPDEEFVPFVGDDDPTDEDPEDGEWDEGDSPYDNLGEDLQDEDANGSES